MYLCGHNSILIKKTFIANLCFAFPRPETPAVSAATSENPDGQLPKSLAPCRLGPYPSRELRGIDKQAELWLEHNSKKTKRNLALPLATGGFVGIASINLDGALGVVKRVPPVLSSS